MSRFARISETFTSFDELNLRAKIFDGCLIGDTVKITRSNKVTKEDCVFTGIVESVTSTFTPKESGRSDYHYTFNLSGSTVVELHPYHNFSVDILNVQGKWS